MQMENLSVRLVEKNEELRFRNLMQAHHYLGFTPKIGETLWYVATLQGKWVALLIFSAAALKCAVRDIWIGWDFHHQYDRLHLLANNSRFLILPDQHHRNIASRILALCRKSIRTAWPAHFGHPLLMLETFVDPQRFSGAIYKASNWNYLGKTKGYSRVHGGYSLAAGSPKMVFALPLQRNAKRILSSPILEKSLQKGASKIMIGADQMRSLPDFFMDIPDHRRAQGQRHRLSTVLAIAAGAILCGMRGYKAIWDWANGLGPKARMRFGCRRIDGKVPVPSVSTFRNILIEVAPVDLDRALQRWNETYAESDESLAIDGKTMCNAVDDEGRRTHIISVVGCQSKTCLTQKK